MHLVGMYVDKVINLGGSILIHPHQFSSKDTWYRIFLGNFKCKEEALGIPLIRGVGLCYYFKKGGNLTQRRL